LHFVSRRDRRKGKEKALAYEKSAIVSAMLIVAFLFVVGALADPETGRIQDQLAAWIALIVLPIAVVAVFYIEYRIQKKRSAKC
jgi:hypothetical protein